MNEWRIPKGTLCSKCGERLATQRFSEHASAMSIAHGELGDPWCEHCIVSRQLEYARDRATAIPRLEARLAALE
jgi:hypothetical protein